jgi:exopolyphosphatase / guanosine-5'-triphosphate,3'-diphosphate pyrophosphatase
MVRGCVEVLGPTDRRKISIICGVLIRAAPALRSLVALDHEGCCLLEKSVGIGEPFGSGATASAQGRLLPNAADPGANANSAGLRAERPLGPNFRSPLPPQPVAHRFAPQYAALDLGTNNCRLLIARPAGPGFRVVDAFSRIVRLGEGLAATGLLSEEAMTRALDALRVCADKIAARNVAGGRYVATEACRQAGNCDVFLARVSEEVGLEIEIISTTEEARLVVAGCAPLLNPRIPYAIVFDIGGGSTEIVWLRLWGAGGNRRRRPQILGSVSLPFGVVTLTDRFGGTEVSPATYRSMVTEAMTALQPFERTHDLLRHVRTGRVQMLGSSGTVTTLAGIHLALPRYTRALVDGSLLTFEQISIVSAHLAGLDLAGRAANPCIGRERADLVLSGCAILDAICETWPVGRLRVADRGVREGILLDLMRA